MMAASAHVKKALSFAASKLGYKTLKEEQKEAVRAFVAGNDVFVSTPLVCSSLRSEVIRFCNSTDSVSVLGAAGHLNTAALATLRTLPRAVYFTVILQLRLRKLNHSLPLCKNLIPRGRLGDRVFTRPLFVAGYCKRSPT